MVSDKAEVEFTSSPGLLDTLLQYPQCSTHRRHLITHFNGVNWDKLRLEPLGDEIQKLHHEGSICEGRKGLTETETTEQMGNEGQKHCVQRREKRLAENGHPSAPVTLR